MDPCVGRWVRMLVHDSWGAEFSYAVWLVKGKDVL